ncbi:hypothetical protein BCR44DRAFT_354213 [Catenaria anguillulae PL171]|uniref:Uncharacterized protein n=1 Tax=Catenaria anguillulae PL171 TaxID=765915 RepID=A0A1Y2H5H6_9FUNG|nr:hypothetical protein BCR44DRAFT_354213 [Catenaria anguillulae PL171]
MRVYACFVGQVGVVVHSASSVLCICGSWFGCAIHSLISRTFLWKSKRWSKRRVVERGQTVLVSRAATAWAHACVLPGAAIGIHSLCFWYPIVCSTRDSPKADSHCFLASLWRRVQKRRNRCMRRAGYMEEEESHSCYWVSLTCFLCHIR